MMLEGPLFHAAIGRLPEVERSLRAWGLAIQVAMVIESPVIMLLTTSVALVQDGPSFRALRRFTLLLCLWVTALQGLVSFTPLFDWIAGGLLGFPAETVAAARTPMQILLFWSAAIGWRRFTQGMLVRSGQTRFVTVGTALRLAAIGASAWAMVRDSRVAGADAAAIAIMAGVAAEAAATSWLARPLMRHLDATPGADDWTLLRIARFHAPLAVTTVLGLIAGPITAAALAKLPDRAATLAAWPVVFSALLVLRGWGFAIQEITVGQLRTGQSAPPLLLRFTVRVGLSTSLAALLFAATPLLGLYAGALHLPPTLLPLVRTGLLWSVPLPLLTALGAWVRGALTADGATGPVYQGMALALAGQIAVLVGAVALQLPAIPAAALGLATAEAVGLAFQWRIYSRSRRSSNAPSRTRASISDQKT